MPNRYGFLVTQSLESGQIIAVYDAELKNPEIRDAVEILNAPGLDAGRETICLQNLGHSSLHFYTDPHEPYLPPLTIESGETIEILAETWQIIWGSPSSAYIVDRWMHSGLLKVFAPPAAGTSERVNARKTKRQQRGIFVNAEPVAELANTEILVNDVPVGAIDKGDARPFKSKVSVTFREAQQYLGITERRRQQLVKDGTLIVVGGGQNRRITVKSLFDYLPERKPEATRNDPK